MEVLRAPAPARAAYWCLRPPSPASQTPALPLHEQIRKTRVVVLHASQPLLASLELEHKTVPTVNLWNYDLHQLLWSKTCAQVYHDAAGDSTMKPFQFDPSTEQPHSDKGSSWFRDEYRQGVVGEDAYDRSRSAAATGTIKDLKFGTLAAVVPRSKDAVGVRLLVVGDSFVIVYFCSCNRHVVISSTDLGRKIPSCAEVLSDDLILIGCTDGCIRVWSIARHAIEVTVVATPRADVASLRLFPPKLGEEMTGDFSKVVAVGSDGFAVLCLYPFTEAPVKLGDGVLPGQDVFVDRESQTLFLANSDHKLSLWDVSEAGMRTSSRSSASASARRGSTFGFKRADSASAAARALASHGAFKLDKSAPPHLSKMEGFAPTCHPYFGSAHTFFVCSHSHALAIVQNKSSGAGEDSESASNVATSEKASRLQVLYEINVQQLLGTHAAEKLGLVIAPEQWARSALKIYQVHTTPTRPHTLALATSYGPMVLDLAFKQGPRVGRHALWLDAALYAHEHHVMLIRTPPLDAPGAATLPLLASTSAALDAGDLVITSKKLDAAGLHGTSADLFGTSHALVYPSPSGLLAALHWPESQVYIIVRLSSAGDSGLQLAELDKGYAAEVAWVGVDDHFLVKSPAAYLLSTEQKRRASMFSFGKKDAQVTKTFRRSALALKQVVGGAVEARGDVVLADGPPAERVLGLCSGKIVCVNFVHSSDKDPVTVNEESGLLPTSVYAAKTYSQFYALNASASALVACSPILDTVQFAVWDYARDSCTTVHAGGVVNSLRLTRHKDGKVTLDATACLLGASSDFPLSVAHFDGLHVLSSYRSLRIHALDEQGLMHRSVHLAPSMQVHEVLQLSHSHVLLLLRDGSVRLENVETADGRLLNFLVSLSDDM